MTDQITEVNNADVLFANRDLHLLWLPPIFHSPSLHTLPSGVLSWHWRCDLTFLSWLNGVARKAGDNLPPALAARVAFVRSYVSAENGINDDNWREKMPAPGAQLPNEFPISTVTLFDAHVGPWWPGIDAAAVEVKREKPLRTEFFAPAEFKQFLDTQEYAAKKKESKRPKGMSKPNEGEENPAF